MTNAITQATYNFFTNILSLKVDTAKSSGTNFYGAAIALYENDIETQWYLLFKKDTLNEFSKILLCEDCLNEDGLDDLVKEVANLIIGSAKVILEKQNTNNKYKLSTPDFLGHVPKLSLLKLDEQDLYKVKNRTFVIGKKISS